MRPRSGFNNRELGTVARTTNWVVAAAVAVRGDQPRDADTMQRKEGGRMSSGANDVLAAVRNAGILKPKAAAAGNVRNRFILTQRKFKIAGTLGLPSEAFQARNENACIIAQRRSIRRALTMPQLSAAKKQELPSAAGAGQYKVHRSGRGGTLEKGSF